MTLLGTSNFSGKYGSHYFYSVYYDYIQDTVNNKTIFTFYGYIGGDKYADAYGTACTCYIDGKAIGSFSTITANSNKLIGTTTKEVPHNQDGSFPNTTIYAYCNTPWTNLGNTSMSVTISSNSIPSIARKSTFGSIPNFTFDKNELESIPFSVPITKNYSGFYNVLKIYVKKNNSFEFITTRENFNGGAITLTEDELKLVYSLMDDTSSDFKFELITYSNSSKTTIIGTDVRENVLGSISSIDILPTFDVSSVQYEDINPETLSITGNKNIFIKNYSDIKITFTEKGTANKGASLGDQSYSARVTTTNGSVIKSLNHSDLFPASVEFEKIADSQLDIFVFDSRGLRYPKANHYQTVEMWDYVPVSFKESNCKVNRTNDVEKATFITLEGIYYDFKENIGVNKITSTILKYKEKNSTSDYTELDITSHIVCEEGLFSITNYSLGDFNVTKEYEFIVEVEDKLSKATLNLNLNSATPYIWHMKKNKIMGIGGKPNTSLKEGSIHLHGDIQVDGKYIDIYPVGSIYMSINNTNPSTLFGGTWEQIKDCFLLSAGNIYTAGSTGGKATHTLSVNEMPSHTHSQNPHGHPQHPDTWMNVDNPWVPKSGYYYAHSGSGVSDRFYTGSVTATNNSTGGSQPHNNMPPYLVVYVWKRVS